MAMTGEARVLLVDDERLVLRSLEKTLLRAGLDVATAGDAKSGLDAFRAALKGGVPFHVAVLDLHMPNLDGRDDSDAGLELLSKLIELDAGLPVVVLTAFDEVARAKEAVARGARTYIVKGREAELVEVVKGLLESRPGGPAVPDGTPGGVTLAERRATLLQAAARVGRSVTSILDPDQLLDRAVDIICDEFGFYYAGVFLIDETGRWAVLRAGRGAAGAAMIAEGHRLEVGGRSMIGAATGGRRAFIALDVGEEPVHFKNPHLPHTRSEMALPLIVGDALLGALTVQSVEEAAFSEDDVTALQAMADQLAVAINNARLLKDLEAANAELVRTKTFEAIATATTEAIHWIGNKALPITAGVARLRDDLDLLPPGHAELVDSMREDLALIEESARLIRAVQEHLIGPARERKPRPAMADDVVKDAAVALGISGKVIEYAIARNLPLVRVDTTQLRRAFGYVLKNALEAMEGMVRQRITVEAAPADDGRFVAVRIADTGPGIPEGDLANIWAAFYSTKGAEHAGLGLSATLRILNEIGGRVTATNTSRGALFELLLPVFDGPLPPAELPSGRSILLIDDDDAWSRFARKALKGAGNRVTRSADMRADPARFDLVLLDDVLEKADSEGLLRWLGTLNAADKVVVVASGLRVERAMQLMQLGARDVVLKPYTVAALAEIAG